MMICRMLSPGLLAALMHAESWVDNESNSENTVVQFDRAVSKSGTSPVRPNNAKNDNQYQRAK